MPKKPYPSEVQDRFIVRLPDGMRDKIAATAKKNNRSMNAEIIARLQQSFESTNDPTALPDSRKAEILEYLERLDAKLSSRK